jgi:hypothetical protein
MSGPSGSILLTPGRNIGDQHGTLLIEREHPIVR